MYSSIITDLKKSATPIFMKIYLFHGSVLNQVNLLIFQAQSFAKIILLPFDSSKSDPSYSQSFQMAHEA